MSEPDLNVQQMAKSAGVSEDKVRRWCRAGVIEGAWDAGDGKREVWRVPAEQWEKFRESRRTRTAIAEARAYVRSQPRRGEGEYIPVYAGH